MDLHARTVEVVVIGAGLTGSCVALELARQGLEVVLIDQDETPCNRASLRNEGKIHLGLVYAADRSLETARLMVQGALSFRDLLRRWLGDEIDRLPTSTPFHYLVATDSLLSANRIEDHFEAVEELYNEEVAVGPYTDYLGTRPSKLFRQLPNDAHSRTTARFETVELAVDSDRLANIVRVAIAMAPSIRFLPRRRVTEVTDEGETIRVNGRHAEGTWEVRTRQVVNAAWDGQMALDLTVGLEPAEGWVHRLKFRVIIQIPESLKDGPSMTIVSGKYGDVVIRNDGTAYLSWYPAAMRAWSVDIEPPESWRGPSIGVVATQTARQICQEMLEGISPWYPGLHLAEPLVVDAGVIVAHGRSDIDDPVSGLHARTTVGVRSRGGYISVNPGKLTTAPLFALEAASRVLDLQSRRSLSAAVPGN